MDKIQNFIEFQRRLHESRRPVIKKYVPKHAPIRNRVLRYLYENGPVQRDDFYQFLFGVTESNSKPIATKSWLSKNKMYFKKYQNSHGTYFDLNSFGRKIVERLSKLTEGEDFDGDSEDHMEINLEPDEEVELRIGDLEIEISQASQADDTETLRSKNSINIDDLKDDDDETDKPSDMSFDFSAPPSSTKGDKNIIDYDDYDSKSK